MEKVLETRDLRKRLLSCISFSIHAGECLGLVGRSGCGKSTAARIIARLLPAEEGRVFLCGRDITDARGKELSWAYERMQMIFQSPEDSFDPRKNLGWSIGEAMRNRGWDKSRVEKRTDSLLESVGLPREYRERYPHEVSGGECQRAAIARALALSPRLLICDEATSALDVTVQSRVVKLLRRMIRDRGIACLFITHDLAILPMIADRLAVMEGGKIVEEGETLRVIRQPKSSATKELMASNFFRKDEKFTVERGD